MVAAPDEGPAEVTFGAGLDTATFRVATVDDVIVETDSTVTVDLVADSSTPATYALGAAASASVAVENNDEAGLVLVDTEGLETNEWGGTATFRVALKSQPTSPVTVRLTSSDASEGRVSPATLTFTADSWDQQQPVTVTGQNDNEADGSQVYEIRLTVTSADVFYEALLVDAIVVSNVDDDVERLERTAILERGSGFLTSEMGWSTVRAVRKRWETSLPRDEFQLGGVSAVSSEAYGESPFGQGLMWPAASAGDHPGLGVSTGGLLADPSGSVGLNEAGLPSGYQDLGALRLSDVMAGARMSKVLATPEDTADSQYVAVWLQGGRGMFRSGSDEGRLSGGLTAIHGGLDVRLTPNLLTGMAVAWYHGGFGYETSASGISGEADLDLVSVYPYAAWTSDKLELWGTVGWGEGGRGLAVQEQGFDRVTVGVSHRLAAVGAARELAGYGPIDVKLRAEGLFADLSVDGSSAPGAVDFSPFVSTTRAVRGQAEFGWRIRRKHFDLRPFARLGVRYEEGDAFDSGVSGEVAAGVEAAGKHFTLSGEGRYQIRNSEIWSYGYNLAVSYDTEGDGRGLLLGMRADDGVNRFDPWTRALPVSGLSGEGGVNAQLEMGYGFKVGGGLFKPYVRNRFGEIGSKTWETGLDLQFGSNARAQLLWEHIPAADDGAADQNSLSLRGSMRF